MWTLPNWFKSLNILGLEKQIEIYSIFFHPFLSLTAEPDKPTKGPISFDSNPAFFRIVIFESTFKFLS